MISELGITLLSVCGLRYNATVESLVGAGLSSAVHEECP